MKIKVKLEGTNDFKEVEVKEEFSILELKSIVSSLFNIPIKEIELILNDIQLFDELIVSEINFDDNFVFIRRHKLNLPQNNSLPESQSQNQNKIVFPPENNKNQIQKFPNEFNNLKNNNIIEDENYFFEALEKFQYLRKNDREAMKKSLQKYRKIFLTSPEEMDNLFNNNPELGVAVVSGDFDKIEKLLGEIIDKKIKDKREKDFEIIKLINSDPNDPVAQGKILELIQKKNKKENSNFKGKYMPKNLNQVLKLYINIEINEQKIIALIDSGSQLTSMTEKLCKKCNLFDLCDTSESGYTRGIGNFKIIGIIHATEIKVENKKILVRISVFEKCYVNFVIGMNILRTQRCIIDLKKNGLFFPILGITAKFLSDDEIKKSLEEQKDE